MKSSIRRVVTGHADHGHAVFITDDQFDTKIIPSGDAAMATMWTTAEVPAWL